MPSPQTNGPSPVAPVPADSVRRLFDDIDTWGHAVEADPAMEGAVGVTMFDLPSSRDGSVTVLLPQENTRLAPSQALLRIKSRRGGDGRSYLAVVTAGPFVEPDTLRADSHLLVTVSAQGGLFLPPYHGRVQATILGEELADGTLIPPRLRPMPNSPVFLLSDEEARKVLKAEGDMRLGVVVGHSDVPLGIPSAQKSVLPRHTAVLGTTGGGKSTTVARLIHQAQRAGLAVIVLDVEGEYTYLHEPTGDPHMLSALAERGLSAEGLPAGAMTLYHLVGRDCANPGHPSRREFSIQFARMSPYTAMEVLDLSDAQQQRFLEAYDITREVMRRLSIFPAKGDAEQERMAAELDEFERGYPRMTLSLLIDVAGACLHKVQNSDGKRVKTGDVEVSGFTPHNPALRGAEGMQVLKTVLGAKQIQAHPVSWKSLLGKLHRLQRLKVFYNERDRVGPLRYEGMLRPGQVSVIDLSDSGASELNNLVIADLLHGVLEAQDAKYQEYERERERDGAAAPPRVLIIVEEAHEFLSKERLGRMSNVFENVSRIARRGRKRWLGLTFVTQLPQHLPRELLGLCNGFILHKITDPQVVSSLRQTVGSIDESLWDRLSTLAPGQAVASFPHLARPLLVSVDPAPCRLRLID